MAGVTDKDSGNMIQYQEVPTIGGIDGVPSTAKVVAGGHINDVGPTPPNYPETPLLQKDEGERYPSGTVFPEGGINDAPGVH